MINKDLTDTIAAISTPIGEGGIGIVRISGKDALNIADKIFVSKDKQKPTQFKTYTTHYGWVKDNSKIIDEVILTVMRSPRSYTKEDIVEINCHGGIVALRKVLDLVLVSGCRLAEPGEFTKRAFLNGRIDLAQAEAVIDIIRAKTDSALNIGTEQLKGVFSEKINWSCKILLDILAILEANIDFPEEEISAASFSDISKKLKQINNEFISLLDNSKTARIFREGIHVVICGRPNVGKSSLFNALVGKRRSITHSDPGVTRDPVEETCTLGGIRLLLVDTGGFAPGGATIDRVVSERSLAAALAADLVLLVLDAMERTPEDEDFMNRLRPLSDKLLLVVNKVDTPDRDTLVWNAHSHGFPNVIGVSAAHGRNLPELKELIASLIEKETARPATPRKRSVAEERGESLDREVRIAILGKPNTGKSSLANRLIGENRSIVSPVPGTTRDVVEGKFEHSGRTFAVLDTAGIRRKSRVTDAVEYYSVNRAIESIQRADLVLLMIDATEGLVDQDKKIAAQAIKEGRGIVIVPSKWDLLDKAGSPAAKANSRGARAGGRAAKASGLTAQVSDRVRFQFPVLGFAPIAPVSSLTGYGIHALLDTALSVWEQLHRRVTTGRLNAALESWTAHYPLPGRGTYKIRFATQVGSNPIRFVIFVNKVSGFPSSYISYLENCIRRDLGFPDVPMTVEVRRSGKTDPHGR
jgi:GTP-binding protein